MDSAINILDMKKQAYKLRKDVLDMIWHCDSHAGHLGGSLSAAEILTVLYWDVMRIDPANPKFPGRDRLVFSKGHCAPILYAALAERGFFPVSLLHTYRDVNSLLQGHPDSNKTPGVDTSSGSLGQGLSIALGMALACRNTGLDYNVYCVLSDGELYEGMLWEALMAASQYHVHNLTVLVDYNRMLVTESMENVLEIEPLESKLRSFGWRCTTVDGHSIEAIRTAFALRNTNDDKPFAIICKTIKGKGVSFMENNTTWHSGVITEELYGEAISQLDRTLNNLL